MRQIIKIYRILGLAAAVLLLVSGCAGKKQSAATMQGPTCEEALTGELSTMTDSQVAALLDEAIEAQPQECWLPVMQELLEEKNEIPHQHLAEAVKRFNRQRYAEYFHLAVYRYLTDLAKGVDTYEPDDRVLLESYASYTIRTASSTNDPNIRQAQLLCRKLDTDLYARLFE